MRSVFLCIPTKAVQSGTKRARVGIRSDAMPGVLQCTQGSVGLTGSDVTGRVEPQQPVIK